MLIAMEEAAEAAQCTDYAAEADEAFHMVAELRDSFQSTPMEELIEAGVRFRMTAGTHEVTQERELHLLDKNIFDRSEFERHFDVIEGIDMDYDQNDPPIETRGSYWAGPWEKQDPEEDTPMSKKVQKAAAKLWDKINSLDPERLAQLYFKLQLQSFPLKARQLLQAAVDRKLKPLIQEINAEKKRKLAQVSPNGQFIEQDMGELLSNLFFEHQAIQEFAQTKLDQLQRLVLKEDDPPQAEFKPIIEDEGVSIDNKFSRLDATCIDHLQGEKHRRISEIQDWFHQMWNGDGKKNCSGDEARHFMRNKIDREYRFEKAMAWVRRQTSPARMKLAMSELDERYRASRSQCFKKRQWSEVWLTKQQHKELKEAMTKKVAP
jgi:hypothetical protein